MKRCIQDLVKNAIFTHAKYDFIVNNMDYNKQSIYSIKKTGSPIYHFQPFRNVETTSSMENIMILIFNKPSRRGADNRSQVPVIGTKAFIN